MGLVCWLSTAAKPIAADFAVSTSRKLGRIHADGAWPPDLEVIVDFYDILDSTMLERLSDLSRSGQVVGLIVASSRSELSGLARKVVRARNGSPTKNPFLLDTIASGEFGVHRVGSRIMVGNRAPEAIRPLLASQPDILRMRGHADGVDLQLPGAILCSVAERSNRVSSRTDQPPHCVAHAKCWRLDIDLRDIDTHSSIVRPRDISAKMIILDACHGALPADGSVAPGWGLLSSLLGNADTECILATMDYSISNAFDREALLESLLQGDAVGEAIRKLGSPDAVWAGKFDRWLLFGDPLQRVCAPPSTELARTSCIRRDRLVTPSNHRSIEDGRPTDESDEYELPDLVEMGWVRMAELAIRSADDSELVGVEPCPVCHAKTRLFRLATRSNPRMLSICSCCGPLGSWPHGRNPVNLNFDGSLIHLRGYLPQSGWEGALIVWGNRSGTGLEKAWPRDDAGSPTDKIELPKLDFTRHARIGTIFKDESWSYVSYPLREWMPDDYRAAIRVSAGWRN